MNIAKSNYSLLILLLASGCLLQPEMEVSSDVTAISAEEGEAASQPEQQTQTEFKAPVSLVGEVVSEDSDIYRKLEEQIPDPIAEREFVLAELLKDLSESDRRYYENILAYIDTIDRESKVELSLAEVIRRLLDNSYAIRVDSYTPAINAATIVEAESIFDTVFFTNANLRRANTPTATELEPTGSTNRVFNTGINKLLPTGMSVSAFWSVNRLEVDDFPFATLNPSYRNQFTMSLRQSLLRGFGLDVNRSAITLARLNRGISEHEFRRNVRDRLAEVEGAYWQLVGARRNVVIASRLIAEFQKIYDDLYARFRIGFDVSKVEITDAKARLDSQKAQFVRVKNNVKDAEDQLKNLMNDPELNLADETEIVPTEFPNAEQLVIDRFAELQAALDNRAELKEAELAIESAKISVGRAKNLALPQFDVAFSYTYDSLGKSQHDAFQNLSDLDFHNYTVGLEFEWPIGNRGPRAALRRARLEHARSLAALKQLIEGIILEVNLAVRELYTNYEQISTNLTSVESQIDQVKAIEDRAERRDPDQLNRELNARQGLASSRQTLLESLLKYNFALTELERVKGTLLEYNNVIVVDSRGNP